MKKLLVLYLVVLMTILMVACGENKTTKEPSGNSNQSTNVTEEPPNDAVQAIVSREEIFGVYSTEFSESYIIIFRQDSILMGWKSKPSEANALYQIYDWKIKGNRLVISEATGMGDAIFDIIKDNDTIQLKFIEFADGDGGALNALPELLSVLTKIEEE